MRWIRQIIDRRTLALERIATALERIAPAIEQVPDELKAEDAITYVDEEALARQEIAEQMGELARWEREQAEAQEAEAEDV